MNTMIYVNESTVTKLTNKVIQYEKNKLEKWLNLWLSTRVDCIQREIGVDSASQLDLFFFFQDPKIPHIQGRSFLFSSTFM